MNESVDRKLKHLLMRAWRERWTALMWGIYVKEVIPAGSSGDEHSLANCIIEQALTGPSSNRLLLSYLQHSLTSQIISYTSFINNVCKYGNIDKPKCVIDLLRLLQSSLKTLNCQGSGDSCLSLSLSLLSLFKWLLTLMSEALLRVCGSNSEDFLVILKECVTLLEDLIKDDLVTSLLYVAHYENAQMENHFVNCCSQVEANLGNWISSGHPGADSVMAERALNTIQQCRIADMIHKSKSVQGRRNKFSDSICTDIHILIAIEALLCPASESQQLSHQLLQIYKQKRYTAAELYCEILRACCLGLADTADSADELRWCVFAFLKVPTLLLRLHRAITGTDGTVGTTEPSSDVVSGFKRLLFYPSLLEAADAKCHCNVMEALLGEVKNRAGLLADRHVASILAKREALVGGGLKLESSTTQSATLILRAEPTVGSILKTIDIDYAKTPETYLAVLLHLLSGKSFELILNAAAGTGKLRAFANRLVRFNEYNLQPGPEPRKNPITRALLFDISFLMLCRVAQMYGVEVVLNSDPGNETFFERWAGEWLNPSHIPDTQLTRYDPTVVDQLLRTLNSGEGDLRNGNVRWHEACANIPAVVREIIEAWQSELIADEDVVRMLDVLRTQMCCLPVCVAAWLRHYIQVQPAHARARPSSVLEHLMSPLNQEDLAANEHHRERCGLMLQVIRRMTRDVQPNRQDGSLKETSRGSLHGENESLERRFSNLWTKLLKQGWADNEVMTGFDTLFTVSGSVWLVTTMTKAMLAEQPSDRRQRCVDAAFSLCHLDLEGCAAALAAKVLPDLFLKTTSLASDEEIGGPGGEAVALFSVNLLAAALQFPAESGSLTPLLRSDRGLKRQLEWDDLCHQIDKPVWKKSGSGDSVLTEDAFATEQCDETKPLPRAVMQLMRLMTRVVQEGIITPQAAFCSYFLSAISENLGPNTMSSMESLLNLTPPALVFYVIVAFPDLLSLADIAKILARPGSSNARAKVVSRILCAAQNVRHSSPFTC